MRKNTLALHGGSQIFYVYKMLIVYTHMSVRIERKLSVNTATGI